MLTKKLQQMLKEIRESPLKDKVHPIEKEWVAHIWRKFGDDEDDPPCPMTIKGIEILWKKATDPKWTPPW